MGGSIPPTGTNKQIYNIMFPTIFLIGFAVGLGFTCVGFSLALFFGDKTKYRILNETAHCNECEIEMPMRQNLETGAYSCTNCKLIHRNEF